MERTYTQKDNGTVEMKMVRIEELTHIEVGMRIAECDDDLARLREDAKYLKERYAKVIAEREELRNIKRKMEESQGHGELELDLE